MAGVPAEEWQRLSCGEGAQGSRWYDWAYVPVRPALRDGPEPWVHGVGARRGGTAWVHGVLARRPPERTDEVACSLGYAPKDTPVGEVVRAAGARWTIDDRFKLAKGQVGLDHYEVRRGQGWYRHITLALLALAVLTISARQRARRKGRHLPPALPPAHDTSRSPFPRSVACWSGSCGPLHAHRPASLTSWRGPAGAAAIRSSPKTATVGAA